MAQQLGIDLVLSGHDHIYHRATICDNVTQTVNSSIQAGQGVTYVQCGSSGSGCGCGENHRPIWNRVYDTPGAVYSLIAVTADKISLKAAELSEDHTEGIVFDEIDIVK